MKFSIIVVALNPGEKLEKTLNSIFSQTCTDYEIILCDVAVPGKVEKIGILYGDTIGEKNGVIIAAPPKMMGFTCYRNIPCHQACFYRQDLCKRKPYEQTYRIRADYDHFLW